MKTEATKCKCRYKDGLSPLSKISLSYGDPCRFGPMLKYCDSLKGDKSGNFDAEFRGGKWHVIIGPPAILYKEIYDESSFRKYFEIVWNK